MICVILWRIKKGQDGKSWLTGKPVTQLFAATYSRFALDVRPAIAGIDLVEAESIRRRRSVSSNGEEKAAKATRKSGRHLRVPVLPEEEAGIKQNAAACSLSVAAYLRNVGLGYLPQSRLDQKALLELLHLHGDLGRLGGLLKMWLSNDERLGALDIRKLYDDIVCTQGALKAKIEELS